MTSLDDALAEGSAQFGPHQLKAYWRESDGAVDGSVNADTPTDLSVQSNGQMVIAHSLDDGLPDPVTMTTSADASGSLVAGLLGREGLTLATSGLRTLEFTSAAAQTLVTAPIPSAAIRDDFVVACVLIDDSTATLVQTVNDPKDSWDYLGTVTDAPLSMYVYCKRRWRTGNPALMLLSDKPVDFMSTSIAAWARNPTGMALDYRVTDAQLTAESASVTTHTLSSRLSGRGYQLGFWGSASVGAITPTAPMVLQGNPALNGLVITAAARPLADSGVYSASATQSPANAIMCMAGISIEPYARPRTTARQYFSPFNKDSPVYGWDRDTAAVLASLRVLTKTGPVDTPVFAGQMQSIEANTLPASLSAVSRTRIRMNQTASLPVVSGVREGLTTDWLITWLAARGSQFVGPAPNRYTRFWLPLYGSMHPHWGLPGDYNAGYIYRPPGPPGGPYGKKNPPSVDGPFLTGMFAEQTLTSTLRLRMGWGTEDFPLGQDAPFPHINEAGGPFMMDIMSQANNRGRMCFWIRADAVASAPAYLDVGEDYIFVTIINVNDQYGNSLGQVRLGIDSATRTAYIRMGYTGPGTGLVTYAASGVLPSDGAWHFFGFFWDFAAGTARVNHNGTESSSSFWAGTYNGITQLPLTDQQGRDQRNDYSVTILTHLPMSDILMDFGRPYAAGFWDDIWPTPAAPGGSMTYRPTKVPLAGLASPEAVNIWDTLADLARNTLSMYRVNEADNLEVLPLPYFGETAQTTVASVQDTSKNTADLMPFVDASRTRNVVTVQFKDTRVDSSPQPMLLYSTAVEIPKGTTFLTFALDVPCVEVHGAAAPLGTNYQIRNLTSTEITTPTLPKDRHFITMNTSDSGLGTVLSEFQVSASFVSSDGISVTIKFVNTTGATAWMVNGGDQVPSLQILGYGLRSGDAYTTIRDQDAVRLRGERGVVSEMDWIHNRAAAADLASALLGIVGQPRPQLTLNVVGDPRRKPGQLVTVLDAEETQVAGNWRVLGVQHNIDGPQYTQDLLVVQVLPAAVWDGLDGWDNAVWS